MAGKMMKKGLVATPSNVKALVHKRGKSHTKKGKKMLHDVVASPARNMSHGRSSY